MIVKRSTLLDHNFFTSGFLALWFVNRVEEFFSGWSLTTVFIILAVPFLLRF